MPQRDQRFRIMYGDSIGLVRQMPGHQVAPNAVVDGDNFFVRDGKVGRGNGVEQFAPVFGTVAPVNAVGVYEPVKSDSVLIAGGGSRLKAYVAATGATGAAFARDITGTAFTGTASDVFQFENFAGQLVVTNGLDQLRRYTGTGVFASIADAPFDNAHCIKAWGGYLMAGNVTVASEPYPQAIYWSGINRLDAWDALNVMELTRGSDSIVGMAILGDSLAVYMTNSVYLLYKTGDAAAPFQFRDAVRGVGALNRDAIVEVGPVNFFVGNENVYVFDGAGMPISVGDAIRDDFFGALDGNRKHLVFAEWNPQDDEIVFSRPSGGIGFTDIYRLGGVSSVIAGSRRPLAWYRSTVKESCYMRRVATKVGGGKTWDDIRQQWQVTEMSWNALTSGYVSQIERLLVGSVGGTTYDVNSPQQALDGEAYTAWVATPFLDMGDDSVLKRVVRIYPQFGVREQRDITFYVNTRNAANEMPTVNGPYRLCLDGRIPYLDVNLTARYFQLRFQNSGVGVPWEVTGFVWYFIPRGER